MSLQTRLLHLLRGSAFNLDHVAAQTGANCCPVVRDLAMLTNILGSMKPLSSNKMDMLETRGRVRTATSLTHEGPKKLSDAVEVGRTCRT